MLVAWVGPYTVTAVTPYNVFKVEHLVPGDEADVHASWLKFFVDKDL